MELTEKIETINRLLRDTYGVDTVTGRVMWRVVWAPEQTEKRQYVLDDDVLRVAEMKKYPHIGDRYVLEWLQGVPHAVSDELLGMRMSYEPIWTFMDRDGNYLPPYFEGCKYIIDQLLSKLGKKQAPEKHPDSGKSTEQLVAEHNEKVNRITDELFGDQSQITEQHGDTVILNSSGKL